MPRGRRGRCRGPRWIECLPTITDFRPQGVPAEKLDTIILTPEELEAIRLVDLEGLQQGEAALRMGVSRKALWNDLKLARRKVAEALVSGRAIRIVGGTYLLRSRSNRVVEDEKDKKEDNAELIR